MIEIVRSQTAAMAAWIFEPFVEFVPPKKVAA